MKNSKTGQPQEVIMMFSQQSAEAHIQTLLLKKQQVFLVEYNQLLWRIKNLGAQNNMTEF